MTSDRDANKTLIKSAYDAFKNMVPETWHTPINRVRWQVLGRFRVLPDFLILGVQRGGTTSLYTYLTQHPNIVGGAKKELQFFTPWNGPLGVYWYRACFPSRLSRTLAKIRQQPWLTGEGSPDYIIHPSAPERVYRYVPHAKLIILLRNPVDRAYSHYKYLYRDERYIVGQKKLTFEQALELEKRNQSEWDKMLVDPDYLGLDYLYSAYLARGIYADQVQRWLDRFPRAQFLILRSEDLYADPQCVYDQVLDFLDLPAHKLDMFERYQSTKHVATDMPEDLRQDLIEYFRPHNTRLYELLGRDFEWDR